MEKTFKSLFVIFAMLGLFFLVMVFSFSDSDSPQKEWKSLTNLQVVGYNWPSATKSDPSANKMIVSLECKADSSWYLVFAKGIQRPKLLKNEISSKEIDLEIDNPGGNEFYFWAYSDSLGSKRFKLEAVNVKNIIVIK